MKKETESFSNQVNSEKVKIDMIEQEYLATKNYANNYDFVIQANAQARNFLHGQRNLNSLRL